MSEMAVTADHLIVIGRGQLLADMSIKDFISANSADFARVRTPPTDPQQREKLTAALDRGGRPGAVRAGRRAAGHRRLPLPRISDLAHEAGVRLWELSPHQASLEEAYMRMTQGAVDYRSTSDALAGFEQPGGPGGYAPPAVPEVPQQGWYAPPRPGQNPYAPAPGAPNPYATPQAPQAQAPAQQAPHAPREDAR